MQITITAKDTITPDLRRRLLALQNRRPYLEAAGAALVGMAKRAFNDASLRAAAWPPKKDGSPATLKRKGMLWASLRVTLVTNDSVHAGSDRPYAPVHQFGSQKSKGRGGGIPARPFFPVLGGQFTPRAQKLIGDAIRAKLDAAMK
ncbi:MAG: phage virion morphogenesis protein [Verrucomicrobiales bacterium]|jgi:phage gpG-like protein|nr:phage virion morphogenesis protein [Verrucomicrobiales bacterium]